MKFQRSSSKPGEAREVNLTEAVAASPSRGRPRSAFRPFCARAFVGRDERGWRVLAHRFESEQPRDRAHHAFFFEHAAKLLRHAVAQNRGILAQSRGIWLPHEAGL